MKKCSACGKEKDDNDFYSYELIKNSGRCKECLREKSRKYNATHKDKKQETDKRYRDSNKEKLRIIKKIYVENNRSNISQRQSEWYFLNRERILKDREEYRTAHKETRNSQERIRRATDMIYRLRTNMSKLINNQLKKVSSSKNGSIIKYLPYSIQELKEHLEKQFESWMTWDNYGKYNKHTWNDMDRATWSWNIDHIIPQADLPYTSMTDDNFSKCWALSNLRPYSAKQNVLSGTALGKQRRKKIAL